MYSVIHKMKHCFFLYAVIMTTALFAVSVYCFTSSIPTAGVPMIFLTFLSLLITYNVYARNSRELALAALIREQSRIEVVVVPSLLLRGKEYPIGIPSNQRAL